MAKMTKALVPVLLSLLILAVGCSKPPKMTDINPKSGPSGGGTAITITGEKFKQGATVTIGGKAVTGLTISEDGTRVTGTTPGGPPGSQQVSAKNPKPDEPSETPLSFTYEGLKVLSTVPADGTQFPWQPRTTMASATFSQPLQAGTASIAISGVAGQVSFDASTQTVTFTADKPLRTAQSYQVTVSGAKDNAGNTMADYSFGFSIEEAEKVTWYTVKEGDTLPIIAERPDVYEDETGEKWKDILAVNQDKEWVSEDGQHASDNIVDYKNLKPGMELYIPR